MKKLLPIFLLIISCNAAPDINSARIVAEAYLNALKSDDFSTANSYYSDEGTSSENRISKMKKLDEVMGNVVSYELKDSVVSSLEGEPAIINLTFKVKHEKLTSKELYTLRREEGKYLIINQLVENWN